MRKATLTFSISTDTRIEGRYFADFRVNGRQNTRVGDIDVMVDYLRQVRKACSDNDVNLTVTEHTLGELAHLVR